MPTRSSESLRLCLDRYRRAVEDMMVAKFDLELTAAHIKRAGLSMEQALHCETIARELRWRLLPFQSIEPEHYLAVAEKLQKEYERRDAFNALEFERRKQNGAGKRKARNGNGG